MDNNTFKNIIDAINNFCVASEADIAEIASFFSVVHLKRNEYFLREEQVCKKIGFLNAGLIRHYYPAQHHEVTRWMSLPNDFATSLRSFILQIPSIENLQAVTDCELVVFDRKAFNYLIDRNEAFKTFYIKALEYNYITIEDRVFSLIEKSAEERFEWMAKSQLRFIQQVPVMYTASMLGITPRHLSRLRKKHKI